MSGSLPHQGQAGPSHLSLPLPYGDDSSSASASVTSGPSDGRLGPSRELPPLDFSRPRAPPVSSTSTTRGSTRTSTGSSTSTSTSTRMSRSGSRHSARSGDRGMEVDSIEGPGEGYDTWRGEQERDLGKSEISEPEGALPGLSAICVVGGDQQARYSYASASVFEILGYEPHEMLGRSCYGIFHPDEVPQLMEVHYRALADEQCAAVAIMRLKHKDGHFVECTVSYSTVYDKSLTMISPTQGGTRGFQHASTARDVYEISPASHGRYNVKRQRSRPSSSAATSPGQTNTPSPTLSASPTAPPFKNLPSKPSRSPRTFFLIDRFTDTARVMYVSNDLIVNGQSLKDHPFYSIIKPSDRPLVQKCIEAVKRSSPVISAARDGGGHGYTRFSVLKIPDLPPISSRWPEGTDESERIMPGQEFIPVEGIFTACSDGVTCVIDRFKGGGGGGGGGGEERR